jgi:hypothetical protein
MKRFPVFARVIVAIVLGSSASHAQTYDLQFILAQNDGVVYAVTAQIRSNISTFNMGISNLVITYDSSAIGNPVLDAAFNFNSGLYNPITLTTPAGNRVSINIVFNGSAGGGTTIPSVFTSIVRIRFATKKIAGHSNLQWRIITPSQTGVFSDASLLVTKGTLFGIDTNPLVAIAAAPAPLPVEYSLSQNYPNPFNPSTTIRYGLPQKSDVMLTVYNTVGQQVRVLVNGTQDAGYHEAQFDASELASGLYFYRLQAGTFVQSKKLVLVR